ncbi:5-carboxymethyl-2-hydroxymuconate Delta-isomerase [Novispirillum itersonii]|uniref:5-carboxymethyl-2-hydroxymuconate Delta-isomerase n=1 Tax=Novispirillum itersonii TaxID=189 RepID=UPI00036CE68B|nr:hypothetical protein [Novispirillum itersonii]
MPQNRLTCTAAVYAAVDFKTVLPKIHADLVRLAGAGLGDCKTQVRVADDAVVGDGSGPQDVLHLDLGLLAGRTAEVLTAVGQAAVAHLRGALSDDFAAVQVSVRVVEMDRATYFKG